MEFSHRKHHTPTDVDVFHRVVTDPEPLPGTSRLNPPGLPAVATPNASPAGQPT
jgi:hypothetical protein